ncbi:Uncharacterised protein [Candidatus Bilamarchaeum dharawalense]|uniref:Uncharacterized protein n=1 Tax=Candidatus Bilamarchaeum dharawalense TaxID=2885759 RepID=A0A5E4LRL2_9ARCH|nr:Uncharacterised protein [Candidatus Bilamarchaeum dharawalense]
MYLPASELQQYNGQFTCPYCIMDMRDEDRRRNEVHIDRPKIQELVYSETCDRCGRDLEGRVYILNDKKLCKTCLDSEKDKWELVSGAPMGAGQRISLKPIIEQKKMGVLSTIISETLYLLRLKKKPNIREIIIYDPKMPIKHAKPMAEGALLKTDEKKPETEGLMPIQQENKQLSTIVPLQGKIPISKVETEKPTKDKSKKKSGKSKQDQDKK